MIVPIIMNQYYRNSSRELELERKLEKANSQLKKVKNENERHFEALDEIFGKTHIRYSKGYKDWANVLFNGYRFNSQEMNWIDKEKFNNSVNSLCEYIEKDCKTFAEKEANDYVGYKYNQFRKIQEMGLFGYYDVKREIDDFNKIEPATKSFNQKVSDIIEYHFKNDVKNTYFSMISCDLFNKITSTLKSEIYEVMERKFNSYFYDIEDKYKFTVSSDNLSLEIYSDDY